MFHKSTCHTFIDKKTTKLFQEYTKETCKTMVKNWRHMEVGCMEEKKDTAW